MGTQKTVAELTEDIEVAFPSGQIAKIKAAALRSVLEDIITSYINQQGGIVGGNASAIVADGSGFNVQNSSVTQGNILSGLIPDAVYDGIRSVVYQPDGSTVDNSNAFGAYVRNRSAGGINGNGVMYWGIATAFADNAKVWGWNYILTDTENNSHDSFIGRALVGGEFDFSVYNVTTVVQGIVLEGSSVSQPTGADGFTVGSLSTQSPGSVKWLNGFVVDDGAAITAAYIGASAISGTNVQSTPVQLAYFDGSGVERGIKLFAISDAFVVRHTTYANGVALVMSTTGNPSQVLASGTDINTDLNVGGQGTGVVRSLSKVVLSATTTLRAAMNLPVGTAPASPVDGDVWREDNTNTGLKIRVNGVTKTMTLS